MQQACLVRQLLDEKCFGKFKHVLNVPLSCSRGWRAQRREITEVSGTPSSRWSRPRVGGSYDQAEGTDKTCSSRSSLQLATGWAFRSGRRGAETGLESQQI